MIVALRVLIKFFHSGVIFLAQLFVGMLINHFAVVNMCSHSYSDLDK